MPCHPLLGKNGLARGLLRERVLLIEQLPKLTLCSVVQF